MKTRDTLQWRTILMACGVMGAVADLFAPAFASVMQGDALSLGDDELDDFLGQVLHESHYLERLEENLNYTTPGRLRAVWPKRFPTLESEVGFLHNPEKLANWVYMGRMGNNQPGDGWKYRGRGPIQLTGKENYRLVGLAIGEPLLEEPGRMLEPHVGLKATVRWWEKNLPDAVMGNLVAVTKAVNGGTTGIAERDKITTAARRALKTP